MLFNRCLLKSHQSRDYDCGILLRKFDRDEKETVINSIKE